MIAFFYGAVFIVFLYSIFYVTFSVLQFILPLFAHKILNPLMCSNYDYYINVLITLTRFKLLNLIK